MNNTLMCCTAKFCMYKNSCVRQTKNDPDDINQVSYNFSYTCNDKSNYEDYIPDTERMSK